MPVEEYIGKCFRNNQFIKFDVVKFYQWEEDENGNLVKAYFDVIKNYIEIPQHKGSTFCIENGEVKVQLAQNLGVNTMNNMYAPQNAGLNGNYNLGLGKNFNPLTQVVGGATMQIMHKPTPNKSKVALKVATVFVIIGLLVSTGAMYKEYTAIATRLNNCVTAANNAGYKIVGDKLIKKDEQVASDNDSTK